MQLLVLLFFPETQYSKRNSGCFLNHFTNVDFARKAPDANLERFKLLYASGLLNWVVGEVHVGLVVSD